MKTGNASLPPLDYLLSFEAAAECQSFVGASKLLNISESAISRKVRLLELHYGIPLFDRGYRSIKLTDQGAEFLARIQPALQQLRGASHDIESIRRKKTVTIAATNSVAALWLMPRLNEFNRGDKKLEVTLVASDSDQECLSGEVDLAILRGNGKWPGFQARKLFGETIFPVCSPSYLELNPTAADKRAIPNLETLEVESKHADWMNWNRWMSQSGNSGSRINATARFNTYPLMMQAAVNGLGIALGWGQLVDQLLEAGKLVRPLGEEQIRTSSGYYLLRSDKSAPFDERSAVEKWLLELSNKRRRYAG